MRDYPSANPERFVLLSKKEGQEVYLDLDWLVEKMNARQKTFLSKKLLEDATRNLEEFLAEMEAEMLDHDEEFQEHLREIFENLD